MAWFYGCRRVMKTPQSQTKVPDQDDLIRGILKHSRRRRDSSMMRRIRVMKTPQSPTKGPDQDDLIRGILKHSRRRRDSSMMRRIWVMKTPQSPRDLIRRTWIRGILKNSRRGHSHCKS